MKYTKLGKQILGWIVISIGIVGLVLPLVPGILLIAAGSTMIGSKFVPTKIEQAKRRLGFKVK